VDTDREGVPFVAGAGGRAEPVLSHRQCCQRVSHHTRLGQHTRARPTLSSPLPLLPQTRKMDSEGMTFADGVKSQTAASMIETKLSQHPTRSQVVRPPPSHAPPRLASQSCRRDLSARPAQRSPTDGAPGRNAHAHADRLERASRFTKRLSRRADRSQLQELSQGE
jgi:hypothetical protein